MKKIILLVSLSLIGYKTTAQGCEKEAQIQIINKIKNYDPTDLVPYSKDGEKWAFVDAKTKKQVTDFVLDYAEMFNPHFRTYLKDCEVNIKSDYSFKSEKIQIFQMEADEDTPPKSKATKENLGFDVNIKGKMTAYSKSYKRGDWDNQNISSPIKHNNSYYAILHKKEEDVLINQEGLEQEGFRFKKLISTPYKNNGEEVLYVEDFQNQKGFITLSGRKILYGELISYPFSFYDVLGFSVQNNQDTYVSDITLSGVLDLTTQTWIIKTQKKYKIYRMIISTTEKIDEKDFKNRDKAKIYFLALKGKKHFVLDMKGKPILPKK